MPSCSRAPQAQTNKGSPENADTNTSTAASRSLSSSKRVLTPAVYRPKPTPVNGPLDRTRSTWVCRPQRELTDVVDLTQRYAIVPQDVVAMRRVKVEVRQ